MKGDLQADVFRVKEMLLEAFEDAPRPPRASGIEDSDATLVFNETSELRNSLMIFTPQDLEFLLPQVLIDLLENEDKEDVDGVIDMLNVLSYEPEEKSLLYKRLVGKEGFEAGRQTDAYLRKAKLESFAAFTILQAMAICEWLQVAKSWKELDWYASEIEAAIQYWTNHAPPKRDSHRTNKKPKR